MRVEAAFQTLADLVGPIVAAVSDEPDSPRGLAAHCQREVIAGDLGQSQITHDDIRLKRTHTGQRTQPGVGDFDLMAG